MYVFVTDVVFWGDGSGLGGRGGRLRGDLGGIVGGEGSTSESEEDEGGSSALVGKFELQIYV